MSTIQHLFATVALVLAYHLTQRRISVVLFLAFSYFFYVREFSTKTIPSTTTTEVKEKEKEHKHKGGNGGCGKLCTCKDKKTKPKKTLSDLKAKKGFGQKTRTGVLAGGIDDFVAVDFTATFAKASRVV